MSLASVLRPRSRIVAHPLAIAGTLLSIATAAMAASFDAEITYLAAPRTMEVACLDVSAGACAVVWAGPDDRIHRLLVDRATSTTIPDVGPDTRYCVGVRHDLSWESCAKKRITAGRSRQTVVETD